MNIQRMNLYFDLDNKENREAYEILQKQNKRKTTYIIQAILNDKVDVIDQEMLTAALKKALENIELVEKVSKNEITLENEISNKLMLSILDM